MSTWRPANLKSLPPEASHVLNQLLRETNQRIDDLAKKVPPHQNLKGTATLNFGTIPANSSVERTVNALGVNTSAAVAVSPSLTIGSVHLAWSARVGQNNQILIKVTNPTTGALDANSVKWNWFAIL